MYMNKSSHKPRHSFLLCGILSLLSIGLLESCATRHKIVESVPTTGRSIVILYENDVHCAVDGYPIIAGLRDAIADTAYTQVVSCGDFIQGGTLGALSHGKYITEIMERVGYDAITLGNHEFDFRTPQMLSLLENMKEQVTCCNFVETQTRQTIYHDFIIREVGDRKIAYIGVTTPSTLITMPTAFTDGEGNSIYNLTPDEIADRVQRAANHARRIGANYVIVLSHLGEVAGEMDCTSHKLVAETEGIDAVLDGHSHNIFRQVMVNNLNGEPVPVTQTGTQFKHIGKLVIMPNGKMSFELLDPANIQETSPNIRHQVDSLMQEADKVTRQVVAHNDLPLDLKSPEGLEVSRISETAIGNLVTDALRITTNAQVCILNAGGIRSPLPAGDITYGQMLATLPYDNRTTVAKVTGQQIIDALRLNVIALPRGDGQFPLVSGMRYSVSASTHELSDVEILDASGHYQPIDLTVTYTLASTDYAIFNGGMRKAMIDAEPVRLAFELYVDTFIDYVTNYLNGHITADNARKEGRITVLP